VKQMITIKIFIRMYMLTSRRIVILSLKLLISKTVIHPSFIWMMWRY